MDLADRGGLGALTMRRLGQELGAEAMSLYKHVANKAGILDGLAELSSPRSTCPSRASRGSPRCGGARRPRAPSSPGTPGRWGCWSRGRRAPATLRYYDAVIGSLRGGGFDVALAAHAFARLDSYLRGFTGQEQSLPFDTPAELTELTGDILEQFAAADYPHLAEMAVAHILQPGYDHAAEFEFGLDLILDGLERRRAETR
jgi:AcrR family transcriptional regulator